VSGGAGAAAAVGGGSGFARAPGPLGQQLQAPWLREIEAGAFRNAEDIDVAQRRRAGNRKAARARMRAVAEADRRITLQHCDPVEDPAAYIARSLERIEAIGGDQDGLLARLEALLEAGEAGLAEQPLADRRHRDRGDVEIDEAVGGVVGFRVAGRILVAGAGERLVHLAHGELQSPHRAVAEQAGPVGGRAGRGIEFARRARGRRGSAAADTHCARHADTGTDQAFADHRDRDGGAADHIQHRACRRAGGRELQHVAADIAVDEAGDAGGRNADQHDGLVVVHQPRAGDLPLGRKAHQDPDRAAGVAGGVDPVGVDEGIGREAIAGHHLGERGRALHRAEAVGAGNQGGRLHGRKELGQPARLRR